MGYGVLFIGCVALFAVSGNLLPDTVAYLLLLRASGRLTSHSRMYRYAGLAAILLIPVGLFFDIVQFLIYKDIVSAGGALALVSSVMNSTVRYLFLTVLCATNAAQAKEVGLPKVAGRCNRAYWVCIVTYAANLLVTVFPSLFGDAASYAMLTAMALTYISLIVLMVMSYTCYIHICLEGDEEAPFRKSILNLPIGHVRPAAGSDEDAGKESKRTGGGNARKTGGPKKKRR